MLLKKLKISYNRLKIIEIYFLERHFTVHPDGYRPIVDKLHLHIGSKFSGFDLFFQVFFCFLAKLPVQRYCFLGPRRFDVRWPVALLGLCMKRKLTDYHYLAINFGYR